MSRAFNRVGVLVGRRRLAVLSRELIYSMNWLRSFVAVVVGLGVISIVVRALEFTLFNALAPGPIATMNDYFAIQNQPGVRAAKLVYTTVAGVLGGYLTARIAEFHEVRHAVALAAIETAALAWGFTQGEFASYTPVWLRASLVLFTGPAIIAGATIRARAARLSVRPNPQ